MGVFPEHFWDEAAKVTYSDSDWETAASQSYSSEPTWRTKVLERLRDKRYKAGVVVVSIIAAIILFLVLTLLIRGLFNGLISLTGDGYTPEGGWKTFVDVVAELVSAGLVIWLLYATYTYLWPRPKKST